MFACCQAVNLVKTQPKLAIQIPEAQFIIIPPFEEIYRGVLSSLKHGPTTSCSFLIAEDFKFAQTVRIDFVQSTYLATGLEDFCAVLGN